MTRKRRPDPRIRDKNLRTLMQDNRKYINALINAATQRDEMAESRERYKKAYLRRHRALEKLQKEHDTLVNTAVELEQMTKRSETYKRAFHADQRALFKLQKEHDALLERVKKLEAVLTDRLEHDTKMVEIRSEHNGFLVQSE
jgi:uncharacterized coiled-coil DUF342 family protein